MLNNSAKFLISLICLSTMAVARAEQVSNQDAAKPLTRIELANVSPSTAKYLGDTVRDTVIQYMLENGDLSQQELTRLKQQRKQQIEVLRTLRQNGKSKQWKQKQREFKQQRKARRAEAKSYIAQHPELQARIKTASTAVKRHLKRIEQTKGSSKP